MTTFVTPHATPDGYVLTDAVIFACENTAEAERLLAAEAEKNGQEFVKLIEADTSRAKDIELPEGAEDLEISDITIHCAILVPKKTFATLDTDAVGAIDKDATFYSFGTEEEAEKFIEEKIEERNAGADEENRPKLAGVQSGFYRYPDCIAKFSEMPSHLELDRIAKDAGLETYMNMYVCFERHSRSYSVMPAPRIIVPDYA